MSYHYTNQNRVTTSTQRVANTQLPTQQAQSILTYIDQVPLFQTIQQALAYGQQVGLQGYHTHVFQGTIGYMAGFDHTEASNVSTEVSNEENIIDKFTIDTTKLTELKSIRPFTITGNVGSRFIMQIIQKSSSSSVFEKYYNFATNTFETPSLGLNVNHFLRQKLASSVFTGNIHFPSGTSGGYKILLIADPDSSTTFARTLNNANIFSQDIDDIANTTVTVVFKTINVNTYASNPPSANLTASSSQGIKQTPTVLDIAKTLTNTSSDANGFGLRVTSAFNIDTGIYCEKTHTLNGSISSSKTMVLDSVDNLVVGATITGDSSDSVSGTPVIETIDVDNKTITLTGNNQSLSDNVTLTFRITGRANINDAFGLDVRINNLTELTSSIIQDVATSIGRSRVSGSAISVAKTVRGNISANAGVSGGLNLNGTYGIAGGNHVTVVGNSMRTNTTISEVNTPSSSAGAVTTNQNHNALVSGEDLTFIGSTQALTLTNCNLSINSFPTANLTVNINLDSFITPGTAS